MEYIKDEKNQDRIIQLDAQQFADLCVGIIKGESPPNVKEFIFIYNKDQFIIEERKDIHYIVYLCN